MTNNSVTVAQINQLAKVVDQAQRAAFWLEKLASATSELNVTMQAVKPAPGSIDEAALRIADAAAKRHSGPRTTLIDGQAEYHACAICSVIPEEPLALCPPLSQRKLWLCTPCSDDLVSYCASFNRTQDPVLGVLLPHLVARWLRMVLLEPRALYR